MSKAILIINNCTECPFIGYDVFTNQPRCIDVCSEKDSPREIYDDIDIDEERPDWCPLIPLERRESGEVLPYVVGEPITDEIIEKAIDFGFNECIDEIEIKEEEKKNE